VPSIRHNPDNLARARISRASELAVLLECMADVARFTPSGLYLNANLRSARHNNAAPPKPRTHG